MTTRSLICIIYQGEFAVAQFAEFDGYPEGQGLKILSFLLDPKNIEHLREGMKKIYYPTDEELHEILDRLEELDQKALEESRTDRGFRDIYSYGKSPLSSNWPSLSREAGADILRIIAQPTLKAAEKKRVPILKELEFVNDDLFCEWAYVVDLDKDAFEVFHGSQKKEESVCKRFDNVGNRNDTVPKLLKSFPFIFLPMTERRFHEAIEPDV